MKWNGKSRITSEDMSLDTNRIIQGDSLDILRTLPDESIDCCVTSPPYYGLRDYGVDKQIGLEESPEEYIEKLTQVFREVRRVLRNDGTLWLNIGDSYWGSGSRGFDFTNTLGEASKLQQGSKDAIDLHNLPKLVGNRGGYKNKDLIGIPWMLAFALRADGWYLRQDIIWRKPNPMPESVKDRCTKSHEYIFLLSKRPKYYFDYEAVQETAVSGESVRNKNAEGYQADYAHGDRFSEGNHLYGKNGKRNKRDVWSVSTQAVKEAHFATFPEKLIEPCVLAGCPVGGWCSTRFSGAERQAG